MDNILLNKIITDISDSSVGETFRNEAPPDVREKLFTYSEGLYPFPDSLYISDTPDGCNRFIEVGYPVAALVHDGNRDADFSHVRYILEQPEQISLEDFDYIYRRLSGLPVDILETERLIIRETALEDLDRFYEIYNDPAVISFMEPLYPRKEEEEYQQNYIRNIYGLYGIGMWTVIRKDRDLVIGRMGIEYTTEPGCVELGFMVEADSRRQGLAFEACSAILGYAGELPDVNRVIARVRNDNTASQNLCRKLSMIPGRELNDGLVEWTLNMK